MTFLYNFLFFVSAYTDQLLKKALTETQAKFDVNFKLFVRKRPWFRSSHKPYKFFKGMKKTRTTPIEIANLSAKIRRRKAQNRNTTLLQLSVKVVKHMETLTCNVAQLFTLQ